MHAGAECETGVDLFNGCDVSRHICIYFSYFPIWKNIF